MARLWARQSTVLNRFYPTTNFRSEMPSALSTKLKTLARGAMMALALPCAAGFAQDADKAMPEATGAPRNILPVDQLPDAVAPPPEDARAPAIPARSALSVQVGDLGTLEGPVAGTLDNASGLGSAAWQGSDRATIVTMLQSVPSATPSAAQRLLMRK